MSGFGLNKTVTANVTPSTLVFFDKATPTEVGVVFDPNTPATTDILYISSVDASTWIWDGSAYISYAAPSVSSTEWYLYGTTIDAGSNKTASIQRSGAIFVNVDSYFYDVRVGRGNGSIGSNTIVGDKCLLSNTTGAKITAVGAGALQFNTASNNTAVGWGSLTFNSSGTNNTGVGSEALLRNVTGSNNSAIGYQAGEYLANGSTANTTPENSVFLGYSTRSLTNNDTNQIVIGYLALGKGSNTVQLGNTSITATYLQGEVNINPVSGQISRAIINSDNNVGALLSFRTANLPRWAIRKDGNETGANVGGDLAVRRYDDAGAFIDTPISIKRSTGAVTLNSAYALPTVAPTSGQVLGYLGAGTTQWTTPSSSSGIWGIANASGVYTYYATWALAVAAATSGQVIELFADITEATNTYILKNGVNVNGNGHTITATMTGATACLDDGGVAVICDISNITINKTTGKGVSITNTSSIITGNCILKGVDASSGSLVLYGQLSGWTITGSSRYPVDMFGTAILTNVYISTTDTSAVAISTNASTVKINNCVIKSSGSGITGASGGGIISNCTVNSNTIGISCATGEVNNCSIVTNTSQALSLGAGSTANDCYARSSAGIATGGTSTSYFNNCSIVSDANVLGTSTPNYTNCKMWSKADWVLNGGGGGKIIDCSLITGYNNAAGYCIRESTSNTYVVDCYLEVANSGATPIYSSATPTLYLKGNSVKGTTNFKSAGIVNGQTNTADAQGNIILN